MKFEILGFFAQNSTAELVHFRKPIAWSRGQNDPDTKTVTVILGTACHGFGDLVGKMSKEVAQISRQPR